MSNYLDITHLNVEDAIRSLQAVHPCMRNVYLNPVDYVASGYQGEACIMPVGFQDRLTIWPDVSTRVGRMYFDTDSLKPLCPRHSPIQNKAKSEPWRPSIDEFDLLPDA
jgi:hypothetical protein